MTSHPPDFHAIVEQTLAQSRAVDEPLAKGSNGTAVVARLRLAVAPALLHHVADEAEMATPQEAFSEGAECFLASVASTLAGYFSGSHEDCRHNAITLLRNAIGAIQRGPEESFGAVVERVKRGTAQ